MVAFYELGSARVIERTFIRAYVKSVVRASRVPDDMRSEGFNADQVSEHLAEYITSGRRPADRHAAAFLA